MLVHELIIRIEPSSILILMNIHKKRVVVEHEICLVCVNNDKYFDLVLRNGSYDTKKVLKGIFDELKSSFGWVDDDNRKAEEEFPYIKLMKMKMKNYKLRDKILNYNIGCVFTVFYYKSHKRKFWYNCLFSVADNQSYLIKYYNVIFIIYISNSTFLYSCMMELIPPHYFFIFLYDGIDSTSFFVLKNVERLYKKVCNIWVLTMKKFASIFIQDLESWTEIRLWEFLVCNIWVLTMKKFASIFIQDLESWTET
ncbi:hypothetical protein H8356DRAFT_1427068 [Neocallimastix lanati (nom. inval.)]|nr:hypothetical protein H8356DRAFT_1427068 [Neocallimastix sp. JGI-2020a]